MLRVGLRQPRALQGLVGDELERELFIVRKLVEKEKVGGRGRPRSPWAGRSRAAAERRRQR